MKETVKGFTLLELIIVIGIVAILGTVSVLVLNPAQLFAQARDTSRISDLSTINNALSLYLTDVASPDLNDAGGALTCGTEFGATFEGATELFTGSPTQAPMTATTSVLGTGWVSVGFDDMTGGSPLASLPLDPTNDATYNYQYGCNNTTKTYELNANLESTKYVQDGASDKESTDGGDQPTIYEVGNEPGLDI